MFQDRERGPATRKGIIENGPLSASWSNCYLLRLLRALISISTCRQLQSNVMTGVKSEWQRLTGYGIIFIYAAEKGDGRCKHKKKKGLLRAAAAEQAE